jgi:8-oxo-dGTP pyrophosphatase MutT (NUDIX family)
MDKFSKIIKKKPASPTDEPVIFENDFLKVTNFEDWVVVEEPNVVACLPYLIEENQIIVRQEYIPTFKKVEGNDYFLTVVAGRIETGESPEQALKRELEEEAGIVLREGYQFEFERPVFACKTTTSQFYYCLVPLTENDYHEVIARGDGTKNESISKSVKVDIKYRDHLNPSDLITELLLAKLRVYLAGK